MRIKASIGLLAAAVLLALAPPAQAAFPGANGKITFDVYTPDDNSDIWAMDPNGSNRTLLIDDGRSSAWSADGRRIAYSCPPADRFYYNTCTASADGTAIKHLENSGVGSQYRPSWSPDGKHLIFDNEIEFGHNPPESYGEVWRIDAADGADPIRMAVYGLSGSWSPNGRIAYGEFSSGTDWWVSTVKATTPNTGVRLTESGTDLSPDWSPDGTKIVFESFRDGGGGIYVMNSDGSNETRLLNHGTQPVWSPDGTKIAFQGGGDLWVMNADGTGEVNLTNTPAVREDEPAWQPVPATYVRPKGASPLRVSLVPAFEPCEEPNATHGSPLSSGSCTPPRNRGGYAVFGAATGPSAIGYVRFTAIPGAPDTANNADVEISVNMTDVRRGLDGTDAQGSLDFPVPLRLTDKGNGPFREQAGTVTDYNVGILGYSTNPLHFEVPCTETADPSAGSTCSATTTVNALFPPNPQLPPGQADAVEEGRRSIWELDQIAVWDGGEDGLAESRDDNTVFAVQGVFVP